MTNATRTRMSPRYVLAALAVPLLILAVGIILPVSWSSQITAQLPLHWGVNGPDRFGSLADLLWPLGLIGFVVIVGLGLLGRMVGSEASTQRMFTITNTFLATLFATISIATANAARGVADTASIELSNTVIAVALVGAILLGLLLSTLIQTPTQEAAHTLPSVDSPRAPLSESESGVWISRETSTPSAAIGLFAIAVTTVMALVNHAWGMFIVPILLAVVLGIMFAWTFRVDASGLRCTSALGIFKRHIPLTEIIEARATKTQALKEFGGWGWRVSLKGKTGIILRSGESLEVTMTGNRTFVITTHDAANAAGLLNTLAERVR